jgi:plastocyanin
MRRQFPWGASVVVLAAALLPLVPSYGDEPRLFVIAVDKLAFGDAPKGLRVNDVIEWQSLDIFRHTATASEQSFDVDVPPASRERVVLKRAGRVEYFCRFHPGMKGRLEIAP